MLPSFPKAAFAEMGSNGTRAWWVIEAVQEHGGYDERRNDGGACAVAPGSAAWGGVGQDEL